MIARKLDVTLFKTTAHLKEQVQAKTNNSNKCHSDFSKMKACVRKHCKLVVEKYKAYCLMAMAECFDSADGVPGEMKPD